MEFRISLRQIEMRIGMLLLQKIKKLILSGILMLTFQIVHAESLKDLQSLWLSTENKETSVVSATANSYSLVAMVYTGCAHACPLTIAKMQSILKDFEKNKITNMKVVLASFDVKNDRPEKLKLYQIDKKLSFDQWKFLSAVSDDSARELSVVLGISYKDLGDGDFSHSNVITLISPQGEILSSINNLNANSESLISAYQKHIKAKR